MSKRRVHYVLSTHWDREWHQSFQDFRYRLVRLVDRILAGWDDGELKGPFQTDGQSIMLEDYLEVRPERREEIVRRAGEGKLVIGPWYVMPDEFTVSGESLIRNLRLGRDVARSFGAEPSGAGFMCDMFGHNSQMPQILRGFGISGALIWRGLNMAEHRNVLWRGADGTELPCYRFARVGYCSYADKVRRAFDPLRPFDAKATAEAIDKFIDAVAAASDVEPVLAFDGGDHLEWDPQVYGVLAERMGRQDDRYEIIHTSLDAYQAEMVAQAGHIKTVVEGELREPGLPPSDTDAQWLIPGVLSSRVWLKQANRQCETLLCSWAEPMGAFAAGAAGAEYPQGFLDVAWRWLITNHPHDSIDTCSVDQVHKDMEYRFDQCRQIADRLTIESTRKIAANVAGDVPEGELRVAVFNPLPEHLDEVTELTLEIPTEWPTFNEFFGFEPKPGFTVHDADGNELAYQRLDQAMAQPKLRLYDNGFPKFYQTNNVTVALRLAIPAMGYTTLTVRKAEPGQVTRHPATPGLASSERGMANEHLAVQIESNGTITLTDKRTKQTYSRLLTFEDCADIGDGWYHGVACNDQAFVSSASAADVALVHDGPMLTSFRIRTTMRVPREFNFQAMRRSADLAELVIDSVVSLRPGQDYLDVRTTLHNNADDHRLRVLLPSGADAQTYLADSQFDVVERPIVLRADNHVYRELEVETKPQQSWTAVLDKRRGLVVVADALLESAVRDLPERPIALTLLRGTRRTAFTTGQPGGQGRGVQTFDYRIVPLSAQADRTRLCRMGQQISAGLRSAQMTDKDIAIYRVGDAQLPAMSGFLSVDGPAVVTSVRQVGQALEVRMFNPTDKTIAAAVATTGRPGNMGQPTRWQPVDFESNPVGEGGEFDGSVELKLAPKKIVTLSLS